MTNSREYFLQDINELIILAKNKNDNKVKAKYLELVKKYHPDINDKANKNILNEYMIIINNLFEKVQNGKIQGNKQKDSKSNTQEFNIDINYQLLTKIVELSANLVAKNSKSFNEYVNLLIMETRKSNIHVSQACKLLFSKEMTTKYKDKLHLLNNGLSYYLDLWKSSWAEKEEKATTDFRLYNRKIERTADKYLNEYKNYCDDDEYKDAIEIVMEWLKETNVKIRMN